MDDEASEITEKEPVPIVEAQGKMQFGAKIDAKKYVALKQYANDHNTSMSALIDRAIDWILSGGLEAWEAKNGRTTGLDALWQAVCDAQKAAHSATFGNVDRAIDDWLVALTDALGFALADDKDDVA